METITIGITRHCHVAVNSVPFRHLIPWSQKLGAGPLTSTTTGKTGGLGAEEESYSSVESRGFRWGSVRKEILHPKLYTLKP